MDPFQDDFSDPFTPSSSRGRGRGRDRGRGRERGRGRGRGYYLGGTGAPFGGGPIQVRDPFAEDDQDEILPAVENTFNTGPQTTFNTAKNNFSKPIQPKDPFAMEENDAGAAPQDPFAPMQHQQNSWPPAQMTSNFSSHAPPVQQSYHDGFSGHNRQIDRPMFVEPSTTGYDANTMFERPKSKELLVRHLPKRLENHSAIEAHFSQHVPVVHVSTRPMRNRPGVLNALITFNSLEDAATALRLGRDFEGKKLAISYFQRRTQRPPTFIWQDLIWRNVPAEIANEMAFTKFIRKAIPQRISHMDMSTNFENGTWSTDVVMSFKNQDDAFNAQAKLLSSDGTYDVTPYDGSEQPAGSVVEVPMVPEEEVFMPTQEIDQEAIDKASELAEAAEKLQRRIEALENAKRKSKKTNGKSSAAKDKLKELREKAFGAKNGTEKSREDIHVSAEQPVPKRKVEQCALEDAVDFVGTCPTMCPEKEMEERELQRDLSVFERMPGDAYRVDPTKAVKKYRRSAALAEQPEPYQVRPSPVLAMTMEFLKNLVDTSSEPFYLVHNFVRDRTRSIRQDFTYQGIRDDTHVRILEECVRFHVLSEQKLYGEPEERFSSQQNLEQLDNCLISLREIYAERRRRGFATSKYEAEMLTYYLLFHLFHQNARAEVYYGLNTELFSTPEIQFADKVCETISPVMKNYLSFFPLIEQAPYLMACLMYRMSGRARSDIADLLAKAHTSSLKANNVFEVDEVCKILGFDKKEHAQLLFDCSGWPCKGDSVEVRRSAEYMPYADSRPYRDLVSEKCEGVKLSTIIDGSAVEPPKISARVDLAAIKVKPAVKKNLFVSPLDTKLPKEIVAEEAVPAKTKPAEIFPKEVVREKPTSNSVSFSFGATDSAVGTPPKTIPTFNFGAPFPVLQTFPKPNTNVSTNVQQPQVSAAKPFQSPPKEQSSGKRARHTDDPVSHGLQFAPTNNELKRPRQVGTPPASVPKEVKRPFPSFAPPPPTSGFSGSATKVTFPNLVSAVAPPATSLNNVTPNKDSGIVSPSKMPEKPLPAGTAKSSPPLKLSPVVGVARNATDSDDGTETKLSEDARFLAEEKAKDDIASRELDCLEEELNDVAFSKDRTLWSYRLQLSKFPVWKKDLNRASKELSRVMRAIRKREGRLNELFKKSEKCEPIYADTQERKEWLQETCTEEISSGKKVMDHINALRKNVAILAVRKGVTSDKSCKVELKNAWTNNRKTDYEVDDLKWKASVKSLRKKRKSDTP